LDPKELTMLYTQNHIYPVEYTYCMVQYVYCTGCPIK